MTTDVDEILAHYGVPGMKWGKRNARNANYSDQQNKRDTQVYGKRGAKRINKAMNKGDQISTARGDEKTRRDRVMSKNKYVRQGGKVGGAIAGGAVGFVAVQGLKRAANSSVGRSFIKDKLGSDMAQPLMAALQNPATTAFITAGAGAVGHMLSGDIAVNTRMRAHGYDPNRR